MSDIILNSDPRVVANIEITYPRIVKKFDDHLLEAIIILPIYKNPENVKTTQDALLHNDPDLDAYRKYSHGQDYVKIINEGYGHRFFNDLQSFVRFLSPNANINLLDDIYKHLRHMINDFVVDYQNNNVTYSVYSKDEPTTLRVIYKLLAEGGIGLHVIFYNYHPDAISNSQITLAEVFRFIHTETNYTKTAEVFIEGGLRYSEFTGSTIRNMIDALITSISNYVDDIMYVFDSHYNLCLKDAYKDFTDKFFIYGSSSNKHYNKMLLAGWYKDDVFIMPPSLGYLKVLFLNYNNFRRFDSIVNKKTMSLYGKPIICNPSPGVVRSHLFENEPLREGQQSIANTLYCVPGKNQNVFLSDYTLLLERNILRYENAVRAALYGKRKVESIMARYIGLRRNDLDLKSIEQITNIELAEEIDLKSYITINPDDQTDENTIVVHYFIEIPITTYEVRIIFNAKALEG